MNVYTCDTFEGHYPVGVASVVVAEDRVQAAALLELALRKDGLPQVIDIDQLTEIPMQTEGAYIIDNGNY